MAEKVKQVKRVLPDKEEAKVYPEYQDKMVNQEKWE